MAEFTEDFTGFANAPVDKKGKRLDFRDVDAFVDESDEGKAAEDRRRTPSSITQFKTDDKATNGSPAATVPAVGEDKTGGEPDPDSSSSEDSNPTTVKTAGGKEASGS